MVGTASFGPAGSWALVLSGEELVINGDRPDGLEAVGAGIRTCLLPRDFEAHSAFDRSRHDDTRHCGVDVRRPD